MQVFIFYGMKNLSRKLFNETIRSSKGRKAVELYLFVKERYASSTIPNFTYKKLSEATGLCYTTLKKRIETLKQLDLIEYVGKKKQHLLFKNAKARKSNVNVGVLDKNSIGSISIGLLALFLVEVQKRKDYIRQLLTKKENAKKGDDISSLCREIRKRGLFGRKYVDNGISYKYIAKKLSISFSKVNSLINHAVERGMLTVEKHVERIFSAKHTGKSGFFAFKFIEGRKNCFATEKGIYQVKANSYLLNENMAW